MAQRQRTTEQSVGLAVSSLRRSGHLVVGVWTLCSLDTRSPGWTGVKAGKEWPGLCGDCAVELVRLLERRKREGLGVCPESLARNEIVLRGLVDPLCPKCACPRPDEGRRQDGQVVRMVCPACKHEWRMVVDFVWGELPSE
jgi:hypothetical protein